MALVAARGSLAMVSRLPGLSPAGIARLGSATRHVAQGSRAVTQYEVYAIKYAHHARRAAENFIGGDPHDGPMPLDFFVWAVVGEDRAIVVDTGFDRKVAERRQRQLLLSPAEGLQAIGVDAAKVEDVVVTHMHWDHAGSHE